MGGGSSVLSRAASSKSNTELTAALRANFESHRSSISTPTTNGSDPRTNKASFHDWTSQQESDLYIPSLDAVTGLAEDRQAYDITVKLFYMANIAPAKRCQHTRDAIEFVLKELKVQSIDLLIVSFPGITFDADDESEEDEASDGQSMSAESGQHAEDMESIIRTWRTLETLHGTGVITKLGLSEFGTQRLSKILQAARVRPSVDQINVRDCCVVPKPLIMFARQEGIELLTHNDCTNILPSGTLRELLGPGKNGSGVLAAAGPDSEPQTNGLRGEVEPQWVVKYTAVVKDRGVVENKGYFAVAELHDQQY
jgi:glutamate--cysteine ligase regulatory subunit